MRADELKFCRENAFSGSVPPAGAVVQLFPSSDAKKVVARQQVQTSDKQSLEKFLGVTSRVTAVVWAPPAGVHAAPTYRPKAVPSIAAQGQLQQDKKNVNLEVELAYKSKLEACTAELAAARQEAYASNEAHDGLLRELASWDAEMQQVCPINQPPWHVCKSWCVTQHSLSEEDRGSPCCYAQTFYAFYQ